MSWGLRAHMRNMVLRSTEANASSGGGGGGSGDTKAAASLKCTLQHAPYRRVSEQHVYPPPSDDPDLVDTLVKAALRDTLDSAWLTAGQFTTLVEALEARSTRALCNDVFWWSYLHIYGRRFATAKHTDSMASYKSVLTDVFIESDEDGSGTVDAEELSHVLSRLGVQLPVDSCQQMIDVVVGRDANGECSMDIDGFLEMMCVPQITDCNAHDVAADMEKLKRRASLTFCETFRPLVMPLETKDKITMYFCYTVADAVSRAFDRCFEIADDAGFSGLREQLKDLVMSWFVGLKVNGDQESLRPRSARMPSPRRHRQNDQCNVSIPSMTPRSESLVPPDQHEGYMELWEHLNGLLPIKRQAYVKAFNNGNSPRAAAGQHSGVFSLDTSPKKAPVPTKPPMRDVKRPNTAKTFVAPPKVKAVDQKYGADKRPPVPMINLRGLSPALSACFPTPLPFHRMSMLQKEHYQADYVPFQFSARARQVVEAGVSSRPPTTSAEVVDLQAASSSSRAVSKRAQDAKKLYDLELKEKTLAVSSVFRSVQTNFTLLMRKCCDPEERDNAQRLLDQLLALKTRIDELSMHEDFRYLTHAQRSALMDYTMRISKNAANMRREAGFNNARKSAKEYFEGLGEISIEFLKQETPAVVEATIDVKDFAASSGRRDVGRFLKAHRASIHRTSIQGSATPKPPKLVTQSATDASSSLKKPGPSFRPTASVGRRVTVVVPTETT